LPVYRRRQSFASEVLVLLQPVVGNGNLIGIRCGIQDLSHQRIWIKCDRSHQALQLFGCCRHALTGIIRSGRRYNRWLQPLIIRILLVDGKLLANAVNGCGCHVVCTVWQLSKLRRDCDGIFGIVQ
jgi:hypothetical protein